MTKTSEEKHKLVKDALHTLEEHFDGVVILASYMEDNETHLLDEFKGNGYIAKGMIREFIDVREANIHASINKHYASND